ncbi:3'-5'-exoribonuclease family protein isoform X2 [Wolffia australiana]
MAEGGVEGLAGEMEVEAYRRLFPLPFYERHLVESVRPDGRPLSSARETSIAVGAVTTADGSALVKTGETTMLAAIKLEVMSPSRESPDEGSLVIDFHMPPICSPTVRPGRPAELAPVISQQLSDVITRSKVINQKDLSLISGKAAWLAYLDVYCLNADGSLFDVALLSAIAALAHLHIPLVSLSDDGRVVPLSEDAPRKATREAVNKDRRKLGLKLLPFSLTCLLHKNYILADPTAEEESIMDTPLTVVLDSSHLLVSLYKSGGAVLAFTSSLKECISLTKKRVQELQSLLDEALQSTEMDED